MQSFCITNFSAVNNAIHALKVNREQRENFLKACKEGAPIFIDGKEATYAEVYAVKDAVEDYSAAQVLNQLPLTTIRKYLKDHTKDSIDLVDRLALDAEWAEGHEWDAPISLTDDLQEAIDYIGANPN